jgi:hypothetical protein
MSELREINPPEKKKCKYCNGEGKEEYAYSCCGDILDEDYQICKTCGEHCDGTEKEDCEMCDGTGDAQEEDPGDEADRKYEEKNDK